MGENKINLGLQILKSEWAEDYQVVSLGFFPLNIKIYVVCKFARVLLSSDPTLAPRVYSMGPYQQAPNTDWVSSRYISYPTLKDARIKVTLWV